MAYRAHRVIVSALLFLAITAGAASSASAQAISFARGDYVNDPGARGIAAADFDGDGAPDIATANTGRNTVTILFNRLASGAGFAKTKTYAVGAGPFDLATGDFNGDGRLDLAVAAADDDRIDLLINTGGGSFTVSSIPAPGNPRGLASSDVNADGHADIIYTSFLLNTAAVLFGDGTGQFPSSVVIATGKSPQGVAAADLDGDGHVDFVVANSGASPLSAYYGNGNGAFARRDVAGTQQLNVVTIADFDGDGRLDVAAASTPNNSIAVFRNQPSGGLTHVINLFGPQSSPRGIVAADLNRDGRVDLAVANRGSNSVTVFPGAASGSGWGQPLRFAAGTGSRAVAAADFDGDGRVDLTTGNEYVPAATVLSNRTTVPGPGATAFELHHLPSTRSADEDSAGFQIAVADFNHNGVVDLVVDNGVILDGATPARVEIARENALYARAVVGDFDGDGHLDFARPAAFGTTNLVWPTQLEIVDVFYGDGRGAFTSGPSFSFTNVRGLVAGDLNADGRTDLVGFDFQYTPEPLTFHEQRRVLLGNADRTFLETSRVETGPGFWPIGVADMNQDRAPDLFIWDGYNWKFVVFFGDGAGGFSSSIESATTAYVATPAVADVNEDGIPDIIGFGTRDYTIVVSLGGAGGRSLTTPTIAPLGGGGIAAVVADLTGDGHPDFLTGTGTFAAGLGNGSFGEPRHINVHFGDAVAADVDRDDLLDLVLSGYDYSAMVLYNRKAPGPNLAPIAGAPHTVTRRYVLQFEEDGGIGVPAKGAYDPNLDPLTYEWLDEHGAVKGTDSLMVVTGLPSGTHHFTLVVRDEQGLESRTNVTLIITPYEEVVLLGGNLHGAWQQREDPTADWIANWHPNANAPKVASPLANPANYVDLWFTPDAAQEYKLWFRLKAEGNTWANDSIYVQFEDAVDAAGHPVYAIGSTSALEVNLEECSGCAVSGWGWRDDAWGAKGVMSSVTLRFSTANGFGKRIRIQTREDGVMFDQIVLSSNKYKRTRPGAVKNDTVKLDPTQF